MKKTDFDHVFDKVGPVAAAATSEMIKGLLACALAAGATPRLAVPLVAEEIIETAISFAISMAPAINAKPEELEKLLRGCFEGSIKRAHETAAQVHADMIKQGVTL